MQKRIYCLVKIFKEEDSAYADAFLRKGEMHCKSLEEIKKIEDGDIRGDRHEVPSHWIQPEGVVFTLSLDKKIEGIPEEVVCTDKDFAGPIIIQNTDFDSHYIYCMYAVSINEFEYKYSTEEERVLLEKEINEKLMKEVEIDERIAGLGVVVVVIHNVKDFIDRVKTASSRRMCRGFVEYFDESKTHEFEGVKAIFSKRSQYSYQREYRFVFEPDAKHETAIKFEIGSIEDIAFKTTLAELRNAFYISV